MGCGNPQPVSIGSKRTGGFFPSYIALEDRSISPDAGVPLELDRSACTHQCKHRMMEADAVSVAELGDTRFGDNPTGDWSLPVVRGKGWGWEAEKGVHWPLFGPGLGPVSRIDTQTP